MPTKVSSYLSKLGFKQLNTVSDAAAVNEDSAGEFIVLKNTNRLYRYDANSGAQVDNVFVLNTSSGGNSRWICLGGSGRVPTRIQYTFSSTSNTIPLGITLTSKTDIIYVNVGNTQILYSEYSLNAAQNSIEFSQSFGSGVKAEILVYTGDIADDFNKLQRTLYSKMLTVTNPSITLQDEYSTYVIDVNSAKTFQFTRPANYINSLGAIQFDLLINMTAVSTLTWNSSIKWNNNSAPSFTSINKYLLSFVSYDNGTTWVGVLKLKW